MMFSKARRLGQYAFLAVLSNILWTVSAQEMEWACSQRDSQRTGRTPRVVFSTQPFLAWEVQTSGSIYGSPVILSASQTNISNKDIIGVTTSNGKRVKTFQANGVLKWERATAGSCWGGAACSLDGNNGTLFAADGDGFVYAWNLANGALKWSFQNTTSTVSDERRFLADLTPLGTNGVMAGDWTGGSYPNMNGKLYNITGGAVVATRSLFWMDGATTRSEYAGSPVTLSSDGQSAYYVLRSKGNRVRLACFDPQTGQDRWVHEHNPKISSSNLQMAGVTLDEANGRVFFCANFHNLKGSLLYSVTTDSVLRPYFPIEIPTSYCEPALSPDGQTLYVTTLTSAVLAINADTAEIEWAYLTGAEAVRGSAVVDGEGKILFGDAAGVLHCLRPDGTVLWKYQGDGTGIACSPAITDSGDVIYGTTAGQLRRLTRSPIVIPYVPGASAAMIDGVLSPGEWDGALAIPLEATSPLTNPGWNPLDGDAVYPADCSAVVYVMHDGENLYVGFDITDDDICADWQVTHSPVNCAVWNDDCTEVFIDGDLDRDNTEAAAGSPAGDRDWREGCVPHFGIYNNAYFNKSQYDNIDRYGSEWWAATTTQTQKIYTEYKFAFSGIDTVDGENGYAPIRPGALFGFNALLNDDDGDGDREDQIALHGGDTLNTCYKTQHDWAPALLAPLDSPTPTPTPTPSMTPAPTPTSTPAPDAEKIRRYLLRMDHDPSGLDVNGDNRIDVSDLIYVLSRR